jgi:hypothetical protein
VTVGSAVDVRPELDYEAGRETLEALHMRTQVVGKVKLASLEGSLSGGTRPCSSTAAASRRDW